MAKWASKISTVAFLVAISILLPAQAPTPEPVTDQETELGQAVYDQLKSKVEIIESSPLYDRLKPVVDFISRVAQSQYDHPFKFFLVHEFSQTPSRPRAATSMLSIPCCFSSKIPNSLRAPSAMRSRIQFIATL